MNVVSFLAGFAAPFALVALVFAVGAATERVGWSCRDCDWDTGMTAALPGRVRREWHVRVTRRLLRRCHR